MPTTQINIDDLNSLVDEINQSNKDLEEKIDSLGQEFDNISAQVEDGLTEDEDYLDGLSEKALTDSERDLAKTEVIVEDLLEEI